jgi:hypothetical protein
MSYEEEDTYMSIDRYYKYRIVSTALPTYTDVSFQTIAV